MTDKPNILLITSDQQHWNTIGKHFSEISTPNLDRLADTGMLFHRAYCPNPTCTPTRASIVTGQMPSRHGAWSLGTMLPESSLTVGDLLQKGGYSTALIGKAHLQPLISSSQYPSKESHPLLRNLNYWASDTGPFYGFERAELARNHADECHVGQHYAIWMERKGFLDWRDHFQNTWEGQFDYSDGNAVNHPQQHAWSIPEEYHYNAWIAERTAATMDECKESRKPFFVWASFFDPHPPYLVPEPWASMVDPGKITVPAMVPGEHDDNPPHHKLSQQDNPDFSRYRETSHGNHGMHSHLHDRRKLAKDIAVYYGMISMMDHYIGKILDHLEETGLSDNTLVVFTSDHGHYYGHHGLIAKGPFHYEDGIRVPMIARKPHHIPAGFESHSLQSLVDLAPTFLSAAGLEVPSTMQGLDQFPAWTRPEVSVRQRLTVENHHQPTAIHMKTLVTGQYKLTVYFDQDYGELYNLESDPGEIHNMWNESGSASLREHLVRELLFAEMEQEPMWMPRVSIA